VWVILLRPYYLAKMSSEHEALRSRTQRTLIDFLQTELKVGPTHLRAALLAKSEGHLDHYARAKQNARQSRQLRPSLHESSRRSHGQNRNR
jgi:hypothetical protein